MAAPRLIWEDALQTHLAGNGAELHFVPLGNADSESVEVIGWFVVAISSDGEHRLLMRQRGGPRLIKTFDAIRKLIMTYFPKTSSVSLPVIPRVRDPEAIFDLLGDMNIDFLAKIKN